MPIEIFCNQKSEKIRNGEKMENPFEEMTQVELSPEDIRTFYYKEVKLLLAYDTRIVAKNGITSEEAIPFIAMVFDPSNGNKMTQKNVTIQ